MIENPTFIGQNWLITPAAIAVADTPPKTPADQTWLMVLSGVVAVNLHGDSRSEWLHETVVIFPWDSFQNALDHAIRVHSIPTPSVDHELRFQVEQWAPYAAPSVMFNRNHSIDSGYAVNVWRPNHFSTATDVVSNKAIKKLFTGIQVDLGVRDTDAILHRVSYHITLLGKIRFIEARVID